MCHYRLNEFTAIIRSNIGDCKTCSLKSFFGNVSVDYRSYWSRFVLLKCQLPIGSACKRLTPKWPSDTRLLYTENSCIRSTFSEKNSIVTRLKVRFQFHERRPDKNPKGKELSSEGQNSIALRLTWHGIFLVLTKEKHRRGRRWTSEERNVSRSHLPVRGRPTEDTSRTGSFTTSESIPFPDTSQWKENEENLKDFCTDGM